MTYADAIKHFNEHEVLNKGKPFVFGEDITARQEREMTDTIGHSIFMVHFPEEKEAFDMKRVPEDRALPERVDLVMRALARSSAS